MTLTDLSFYLRRFLPVGVIMGLVVLIFYFAIQLFFVYLQAQQAAQRGPVTYNTVFGSIQKPQIKESTPSNNFSYILDTLDGTTNIPEATPGAQVFFLPQSPSRFGFLQKIYFMAQNAGVDTELVKHTLDDKEAMFNDGARELKIDITNYNFHYQYKLLQNDPILENGQVPLFEQEIENKAIDFLRKLDRYPEELAQGRRAITYYRYNIETEELMKVLTAEEANIAEVDFYRPDIGAIAVSEPSYFHSQNFVVMAFNNVDFKVIRAQVNFYDRSTDPVGVYPLVTAEEAWKKLQDGKGLIVSSNPDIKEVKIKKIFLNYLDPEGYQEYMQPVYVFLGENNFVGYVPALTDTNLVQ